MAHILITGGGGFIGSHLVRGCIDAGHSVVVLDNLSTGSFDQLPQSATCIQGDVTHLETVMGAMSGCNAVFHHAAQVSVLGSQKSPLDTVHSNIWGTSVVLEAARHHQVTHVTVASSAAVYGNSPFSTQSETDPPAPDSPYGVSKWVGETICAMYRQQYGLPVMVWRYFNVVGKGQGIQSDYAAVIPKWAHMLEQRVPLTIYGDGHQTRDFVPVSLIVSLHLQLLQKQEWSDWVINVGSGRSTSLLALSEAMQGVYHTPVGVTHLPPNPAEITHSLANTTRMHSLFLGLSIPTLHDSLSEFRGT